MHGPRDCHTEWSKSEREREISYNIACMWNLMVQMNFLESKYNENIDNKFMITKGEKGKWDKLGDWYWHIYTTMYKIDN